ncbi:hypothetical protein NPIL_206661 [Nephila pilipes]|uniref:Uncharacterized protein n=1 Tax=Nephila pilipes TaxID=299642 RepID=A0A8X6QBS9_NEPPI|nr:hypothetical protein NPIL_206661 [Nephila pilipes]
MTCSFSRLNSVQHETACADHNDNKYTKPNIVQQHLSSFQNICCRKFSRSNQSLNLLYLGKFKIASLMRNEWYPVSCVNFHQRTVLCSRPQMLTARKDRKHQLPPAGLHWSNGTLVHVMTEREREKREERNCLKLFFNIKLSLGRLTIFINENISSSLLPVATYVVPLRILLGN